MKLFVVVSALLATAVARPGYLHGGLAGVTHVAAAPAISYAAAAPAISYAAAPAISYAAAAPAAVTYTAAAPAHISYAAPAVVAPVSISSQYHAQDELGQYNYGYSGALSAKSEARAFDGSVAGGYSYVDANGVVQSAHYVADPVNGFRVAATNLPVAPAAPEAPAVEAPKPVEDTPEVAEAKAAHAAAVAEAAARAAAAPEEPEPAPAPAAVAVAAPAPAAVAYSAPAFAYSAPATVAYSAGPVLAVSPARSFAYHSVAAAPLTYAAHAPVVLASEGLSADAVAHLRAKAALLG